MSSRIKAALERIIRFGSRMKNRSPSSRRRDCEQVWCQFLTSRQSCIGAYSPPCKGGECACPESVANITWDTTLAEQNNGAGDCQYSSPKQIQVEPCRAQQCKAEPPVHNPRGEACYRKIGQCVQTK